MRRNALIEPVEVVNDIATEPVTLAEIKTHLNMIFETSGSYQFNDDDGYLNSLNTIARQYFEEYCAISFAPKKLRAVITNQYGGFEIPYGPIISVESVTDRFGNALAPSNDIYLTQTNTYRLEGNQFKKIFPCSDYLDVVYNAGYPDGKLPAPVKRAILEQIQFMYDYRGSQQGHFNMSDVNVCLSSLSHLGPYVRSSILV